MKIPKNPAALADIASGLMTKLTQYKDDRTTLEQQLLKNLRQYRGKYDPEVETILDDPEHKTRSKVYPRDTRVKVNGFVAKMMEMMFPATEQNWSLKPTPFPNLADEDIQLIIAGLTQQKQVAFQQAQQAAAQQQPPGQAPSGPDPITSDEIEAAVRAVAQVRSDNMATEIEDQLADIGGERIEYPQLVKKVLRSAAIYGFGVVEGPLVRTQEERIWEPTGGGTYIPKKIKKLRPYLEQVKVWDLFPDLSAKNWREQEGLFRRRVFLKNGLADLAARADFEGQAIRDFIKENPDGNYTAMTFEADLDAVNNTTSINKKKKGRFEVFRFLGYLGAEELVKAGVTIPEGQRYKDVLADVWLLGDKVIKADLAPFGDNPADSYFVFIYEDDEESGLTGVGLPEALRDSQMRLCSIDRATMDNAAAVAGPIWESNKALLGHGVNVEAIHAFQVINRDDDNPATAGIPAIHQISTNAYIQDYIALRNEVKQILDYESNLPSLLMGDPSNMGEAFRTSGNMSMMTGAANMVTKDVVRSFDRFTSSVIGALVQWNMEFNDKPEIKGDHQVQAEGSLSLVAKEVRGAALDQLWQNMDDRDRAIVKRRKVLIDRFKSRDLPEDYIEDEETSSKILDRMDQAQAQAQQTADALTQAKTAKSTADASKSDAQAKEILQTLGGKIQNMMADITQKLATAKGETDRGQLEHVKLLLESLAQATGGRANSATQEPGGADSAAAA